ncbi:MAG: ATP-binding protein [Clostridia bacterium]
MKRKIFRGLLFLTLGTLIVFSCACVGAVYFSYEGTVKAQLAQNLTYIASALEGGARADAFRKEVGRADARLTLVDASGQVTFDSRMNPADMENHLARPEIAQAAREGVGASARYSDTLGQITFYEARQLPDGSIARLSVTRTSVVAIGLGLLGALGVLLLGTAALSVWGANRLTAALVRPLNHLDLKKPLDNDVYEELAPLLGRLEAQNRQIATQMAALRAQQIRFSEITRHMAEGLIVLDARENILSINRSVQALFGVEQGAQMGKNVRVLCRDVHLTEALEKACRGTPASAQLILAGRFYQLLVNPVKADGAVEGYVLLMLDVTERALAEQSRREFSANVSHELKTPLTAISGYAELIENGLAQGGDAREFAGRIRAESARLLELIEDIIRLSKLDEGAATGNIQAVDLGLLAQEAVARRMQMAEKAQVKLNVVRGQDARVVTGDRSVLGEMLGNLIDNAIKYNRPGGWVKVTCDASGWTVADNGIGIAREDQARVFERFYRADKSHSRTISGTGLGLSIAKHAAQINNARIELESEPDKGTEVRVIFSASAE